MIRAGTFPSTAPEDAVMRGSLGLMPYEDPAETKQQLIRQIELVCQADPWLRNHPPFVTTEGGYVAAGAEIPGDHPIMQLMKEMFQIAAGKPAMISGRMGAADTRFLIRSGNTPTVIFGPGITSEMHAMNENVPIRPSHYCHKSNRIDNIKLV